MEKNMLIKPFKKNEVILNELFVQSNLNEIQISDTVEIHVDHEGMKIVDFLLDNLREIEKSLNQFKDKIKVENMKEGYEPFVGNQYYENDDYTMDNSDDYIALYGRLSIQKNKEGYRATNELIQLLEKVKDYLLEQPFMKEEITKKPTI